MPQVRIRFYAELNEHLAHHLRQVEFPFEVGEGSSVGETLRLLGVPAREIDLVLVNGESVGLSRAMKEGDRVSVYPVFDAMDVSSVTRMGERPVRRMRFVLDVHLGKLAHHLRLLGFDTLYRNTYSRSDLIDTAAGEDRILLTRSHTLVEAGNVTAGYRIRSSDPREQLIEVLRRFDLWGSAHPFQRCLHCNAVLHQVEKERVVARLPEKVRDFYQRFTLCPSCNRIYWEGTHFARMKEFVERLV